MSANLKTNKFVENLKKGFQDIQTVAQEGNFKLFLKQFIAILVVFLAFKFLSGKFAEKIANYEGQMEAARSIGFKYGESMKLVILPQAVKNILPALGNEFVTVIKESSIVSVIGISDLMYGAQGVIALTYRSLPCLAIAACIYFILTFISSRLIGLLEKRMRHGR